jgi:hypothetical protein
MRRRRDSVCTPEHTSERFAGGNANWNGFPGRCVAPKFRNKAFPRNFERRAAVLELAVT